jgi:hypothetical protein
MPYTIDFEKFSDPGFRAGSMDLGNPPVKPIPHQEFPRVIYNHKRSYGPRINQFRDERTGAISETHIPATVISKTVLSQDELDAALEQGWDLKPPKYEAEEVDMSDKPIETVKRGRPKAS